MISIELFPKEYISSPSKAFQFLKNKNLFYKKYLERLWDDYKLYCPDDHRKWLMEFYQRTWSQWWEMMIFNELKQIGEKVEKRVINQGPDFIVSSRNESTPLYAVEAICASGGIDEGSLSKNEYLLEKKIIQCLDQKEKQLKKFKKRFDSCRNLPIYVGLCLGQLEVSCEDKLINKLKDNLFKHYSAINGVFISNVSLYSRPRRFELSLILLK